MADEKPRILIVDDEKDFREIMATKLNAAGFEVTQAASGQEALAKVKEVKPHLVLMDVKMPGMSGIETLSRMRADPESADFRVLFLTSYGEPTDAAAFVDEKFAKEFGAIGHIKKSDDLDKIVQKIISTLYPQEPQP